MSHHIDSHWANWFVGFCDGESSFTYHTTNSKTRPVKPLFKLTVQDDHDLIKEINDKLLAGGYVSLDKPVKAKRSSGSAYENRSEITVQDKARLSTLVDFFNTYQLRSHKQSEFLIWRQMVLLYCNKPSRSDTLQMIRLAMDLSKDRISGMAQKGRANLELILEEWYIDDEPDDD